MGEREPTVQKTLRVPKNLLDRIEALPKTVGQDFTAKAMALLEKAIEWREWEEQAIEEAKRRGVSPSSAKDENKQTPDENSA
jgi:hypothetical protein